MSESTTRAHPAQIALIVFVWFLAGCWQAADTGPGEIHWDRQTCEQCQMVISERRYAVQVRKVGEHQTHAFDDLGCALLWLDEQGLLDGPNPEPEIWVMDSAGREWVDAHSARFEGGLPTPMVYGFGTAEQGISLSEVEQSVLEAQRRRRTGPSDGTNRSEQERAKGEDVDGN